MDSKIEEILASDGQILRLPVGRSMWPMLRHRRDQMIIDSITAPPRVNDVVLYKRANGQYVLHRIIKVRAEDYIIRGDNCLENEYGITDREIIGILRGFYRGERYIDCRTHLGYKCYVSVWRLTYLPRTLLKRAWGWFKRTIRKIKRK